MGLFGDLVQQAMGGFPKKPSEQAAPNVDLAGTLTSNVAANQAALPGAEKLTGDVNQFNLAQRMGEFQQVAPGLEDVLARNITDWAHGVIPTDVASAVSRAANSRAYAGGYGGSPMAGALTARDLGLTSTQFQQAASSYAPTFFNMAVPGQVNPTSQFSTPQEALSLGQWNALQKSQTDYYNSLLESIPDPATAAIAKDVGGFADLAGSMIPYFGTFYSAGSNMGTSGGPSGGGGGGGGMGVLGNLFGGSGTGGGGGPEAGWYGSVAGWN